MASRILKHKKFVVFTFILLAVISIFAQFTVSVNYNLTEYLPEDSPSTIAMEVMEEEFEDSIQNARVMIHDVSIQEALVFKEKLNEIDGVTNVDWLDDAIDIKMPIEMAEESTVETYYQDDTALISLTIEEEREVEVTDKIYALIGEENAMDGEAVDTAVSQKMTGSETMFAAAILIPIIILILVLSTTSWMEPVFFLTAIGISVLINLGTNIFLGEVSFITQSVAPLLQLAVSLDYAIFLLHSFQDYRKKTENPEEAMRLAMKRSFPAITASASTTFFGFIALSFMDFEIGADLGINLVKGIALSYITVIVFLPAFTVMFYKWIDKTRHKALLPSKWHIGKFVINLRIPMLILVLLIIVPAFMAQSQTNFIFGMGELPENTRAGSDALQIEETFGEYTPVIILAPRGDLSREEQLIQELRNLVNVTSTISYTDAVSTAIPPEYLENTVTEQFFSENYSRIIVNTNAGSDGEEAFQLVETIQDKTEHYYGDEAYVLGESATLYDTKVTVERDNTLVNVMTVVSIAIVLLISFRSISMPVVLLLTIQASVWINLSIPYFTGTALVFIGYLIISTVQLAATVDYGILLTEDYVQNRKKMSALEAIKKSINEKVFSIAVSASILTIVGFVLSFTSTNPIVSDIGLLLGRGALMAFILVICFLPALLLTFDKFIRKTTW
ncbi:MMPL family transporter [Virgibacillus sp. YIM 98842]|uniref:efflux RND transporter permease subunit n=1 Tax=Virgibacillus sp. YIM 98842 TaxID=2663533 RepID=UPI0013D95EC8|nr:MMPL family transporter [Virgibacillus sp. YIM 98842]